MARSFKQLLRKAFRTWRRRGRASSDDLTSASPVAAQPFPFLSLPAELRLLVYDFWYDSKDVVCDRSKLQEFLAIGQVNRHVRNEAVNFLCPRRTFVMTAANLQSTIMLMPDEMRLLVKSVRLEDFPNFTMHYLLGGNHSKQPNTLLASTRSLTDILPSLNHLTIRISKIIDKPPHPSQAILDRFLADVTAEDLLQQQCLQWLRKCRGLAHFELMPRKPLKRDLDILAQQPFAFLRTLVGALDGVEEQLREIVSQGRSCSDDEESSQAVATQRSRHRLRPISI